MKTAVDPVCGKEIDDERALAHTNYQGKDYAFCSQECHDEFKRDASRYVKTYLDSGVTGNLI